jgi:hypothetical protein
MNITRDAVSAVSSQHFGRQAVAHTYCSQTVVLTLEMMWPLSASGTALARLLQGFKDWRGEKGTQC